MKAKMKILYDDGDLNEQSPGTFHVQLRKWESELSIDYILQVTTVSDVKRPNMYTDTIRYALETTQTILNVFDDGEAIRVSATIAQRMFDPDQEEGIK